MPSQYSPSGFAYFLSCTFKRQMKLGVLPHTHSHSSAEAETGSLLTGGQLCYTVRSCFQNKHGRVESKTSIPTQLGCRHFFPHSDCIQFLQHSPDLMKEQSYILTARSLYLQDPRAPGHLPTTESSLYKIRTCWEALLAREPEIT